ncbi:MAG: hypothetical protein HY704_08565 [Gemmatimonadetes bacterium]|nr:hypothetical protein [Gemmatimonadota bacterium]
MRPRMGALVSFILLLPACAYFNALYNARRLFREAEGAARQGQQALAAQKYGESIEKAAKSLRIDDDGRWADDALYLIGRAHFERGDWPAARAALSRALERSGDAGLRAGARAFVGAVDLASGRPDLAVARLDSAVAELDSGELKARTLLWRSRARFALADGAGAWHDLDGAARAAPPHLAVIVQLERLGRAVAAGDSLQARAAVASLLGRAEGRYWADSLRGALSRMAAEWGPGPAFRVLEGLERGAWPASSRDRLLLDRAGLAARLGDTARAVTDADRVAGAGGPLADEARVLLARVRLAGLEQVEELGDARAILLPAIASQEARTLLDAIRRVGLLVEYAGDGETLALLAAAELARDTLESRRLARRLFLAYQEHEGGTPWAGKALLAALDLSEEPDERAEVRKRMDALSENVYVEVASGSEGRGREFQAAEQRLEGVLAAIRRQVDAEAQRRDVAVRQAAASLDSLGAREERTEARRRLRLLRDSAVADSLREDSLRADSLRRDSIRADSARADSLGVDTLFRRLFRDTTRTRRPPL